jgi:hypothetical protein
MANNTKSRSFFGYFRDLGQFQAHGRSLHAGAAAGKPGYQDGISLSVRAPERH